MIVENTSTGDYLDSNRQGQSTLQLSRGFKIHSRDELVRKLNQDNPVNREIVSNITVAVEPILMGHVVRVAEGRPLIGEFTKTGEYLDNTC